MSRVTHFLSLAFKCVNILAGWNRLFLSSSPSFFFPLHDRGDDEPRNWSSNLGPWIRRIVDPAARSRRAWKGPADAKGTSAIIFINLPAQRPSPSGYRITFSVYAAMLSTLSTSSRSLAKVVIDCKVREMMLPSYFTRFFSLVSSRQERRTAPYRYIQPSRSSLSSSMCWLSRHTTTSNPC